MLDAYSPQTLPFLALALTYSQPRPFLHSQTPKRGGRAVRGGGGPRAAHLLGLAAHLLGAHLPAAPCGLATTCFSSASAAWTRTT